MRKTEIGLNLFRDHLGKMPGLAKLPKADLSKGFTVAQVAEKQGWPEPMVWSLALEGKDDLKRFECDQNHATSFSFGIMGL